MWILGFKGLSRGQLIIIVLTIWIGKRCSWFNGNHLEGAIQLVSCDLSYLQHSRQKIIKKEIKKIIKKTIQAFLFMLENILK